MIDFDDLFDFSGKGGPKSEKIIRMLFGAVLFFLSLAGAYKGIVDGFSPTNMLFNISAIGLFLSLALVGLLNIILDIKTKGPATPVLFSFVLIFVVRIVFGP